MAGIKAPIKQQASQGGRVMRQERQEKDLGKKGAAVEKSTKPETY